MTVTSVGSHRLNGHLSTPPFALSALANSTSPRSSRSALSGSLLSARRGSRTPVHGRGARRLPGSLRTLPSTGELRPSAAVGRAVQRGALCCAQPTSDLSALRRPADGGRRTADALARRWTSRRGTRTHTGGRQPRAPPGMRKELARARMRGSVINRVRQGQEGEAGDRCDADWAMFTAG